MFSHPHFIPPPTPRLHRSADFQALGRLQARGELLAVPEACATHAANKLLREKAGVARWVWAVNWQLDCTGLMNDQRETTPDVPF